MPKRRLALVSVRYCKRHSLEFLFWCNVQHNNVAVALSSKVATEYTKEDMVCAERPVLVWCLKIDTQHPSASHVLLLWLFAIQVTYMRHFKPTFWPSKAT